MPSSRAHLPLYEARKEVEVKKPEPMPIRKEPPLPQPIKKMSWEKFQSETDGLKRRFKLSDEMHREHYEEYKKRVRRWI